MKTQRSWIVYLTTYNHSMEQYMLYSYESLRFLWFFYAEYINDKIYEADHCLTLLSVFKH